MKRRWAWAVALVAAAVLLQCACARKERKERKKAHRGAADATAPGDAQRNLCDIREAGVSVYCYCNSPEVDNATEATCWVFNGEKRADDPVWAYFASQRSLERLKFNVRPDGRLRALPAAALHSLAKLKALDVQYATLTDLPPYAFANLSALTEISLSRNQIVTLSPRAFARLPALEQLSLDENRVAELRRDALVLPALRRLYLDRNNLSVVHDGAFAHLARLEELDLSGNQLSVVTRETFAGLRSVKRLDLQMNHLTMLGDGAFAELRALEELELDENELQMLGERCLQGLQRLQRLSLAGNRLRALPPDVLQPAARLRSLDLRDNALSSLPGAVARPMLPALRDATQHAALHLDGNQFECDCRLAWMFALRNETGNEQVRYALEELTCVLTTPLLAADGASPHPLDATEEPDFVRDAPAQGVSRGEEEYEDGAEGATPLPASRRHLFDIPPALLPCPSRLGNPRSSDAPFLTDDYGFGQEVNAMSPAAAPAAPIAAAAASLWLVAAARAAMAT